MLQTSEKSSIVTLINVFTVEPANQQRLVDLLARATDGSVNRAPGFISPTLHRSVDGTNVTMYAQWRSAEDYQAMRQDPGPLPLLEEAGHRVEVNTGAGPGFGVNIGDRTRRACGAA